MPLFPNTKKALFSSFFSLIMLPIQ
jgi:hypothetical protein